MHDLFIYLRSFNWERVMTHIKLTYIEVIELELLPELRSHTTLHYSRSVCD
jgi:hypothetical protein